MAFGEKAWIWIAARRRSIAPTACFALVGIVLFAVAFLSRGYPYLLMSPITGMAETLQFWVHYSAFLGGSPIVRFLVEILMWPLGMQVLWLPYWAVTWKRRLGTRQRVMLFIAMSAGMITINVAFFVMLSPGG